MGLDGDWAENNEILFKDNKFIEEVNFRMYEYSVWAKPIMVVEFKDIPSRTYEVWKKVNENQTNHRIQSNAYKKKMV